MFPWSSLATTGEETVIGVLGLEVGQRSDAFEFQSVALGTLLFVFSFQL